MAKRFLVPVGFHVSVTDPATGSNGQVYFNSSTNELKVYYDGQWNAITSSSASVSTESGVELSTSWWLGA